MRNTCWRIKAMTPTRLSLRQRNGGMEPVILPRKNRKQLRDYDKHLYRLRHLVENAFLHLKRWRGRGIPRSSRQERIHGIPADGLLC